MSDTSDTNAQLPDPNSENDSIPPNLAFPGDEQEVASSEVAPIDDATEPLGPITDSEIAAGEPIPVPDDGLPEWPTNGGPLGCLVGLTTGFVISGFLASTLISFVHFSKGGAGGWFIFGAVVVMLLGVVLFARLGWWVGKRAYREYAPTKRQIRIAERIQRGE